MKKIVSLLISAALLVSMTVTSFAAPSYGSEWDGYYHAAAATYSDVPSTHWAYNAIMRSTEKNWFGGYPDGTFRPDASITRAEALKVFVVFLGLELNDVTESSFYDVPVDEWFAPYIEAGKDLFPTHTSIQGKRPFQPNMPVTREDTVYALVNALGCNVGVKYVDQFVLDMFSDKASISADLKKDFTIAINHELVSGFPDGTIRAQAALTRAEFATLLLRGTEHGFHDKYEAKISSVTVSPASPIEMTIGETVALSARATYTDGKNLAYTDLQPYDATNNGVISLNGTTITALKEGTAQIKYNDSYLKNEILLVNVKKPTDAPTLKITDYDEVTEEATVYVGGSVTDKNGAVDLTCNDKDVAVDSDGSFKAKVNLTVGTNTLKFVAKSAYGVETTKTITIERQESKEEVKEDNTKEETNKEENKNDDNADGQGSSQDGEPYFTFEKATGTITKCGTSATDIVVPETIGGVNVYHIADGAFENCKYLESIQLPNNLKTIGANAFAGCKRLLEVEIPAGVTSIGANAFKDCTAMTDVVLSDEIKKIEEGVFSNCKRLVNVSIFEGVTKIEKEAFAYCTSLVELELPETVKSIGANAFKDCGALSSLIIPDSVDEIDDTAFAGCNALKIYSSVNSYAIEYAKDKGIAWDIY